MGKKKDKHRKHGDGAAHGASGGKGAFAGMAAMAMAQVKNQLDTPAGRQAIATGLRAAADALAPKRTPEPPAPPKPPVPPEAPNATKPSAYAANPAEPPREEVTSSRSDLPPEVARVIGSVAAGLEKWAAKLGRPSNT